MTALRNLSARPTLLRNTGVVVDPAGNQIGVPGPLRRNRVVYALPMAPVQLQPRLVLHDSDGAYLADPNGNLIGTDRVIVHRLLAASPT